MKPKSLCAGALVGLFSASAIAQDRNVSVHVEGDARATVQIREHGAWMFVCKAPCDMRMPVDALYRVGGEGIAPSRPFVLKRSEPVNVLTVHATSSTMRLLGIVLASAGGGLVLSGLAMLLSGWLTYACSDCVAGLANTTMVNIGWGCRERGSLPCSSALSCSVQVRR